VFASIGECPFDTPEPPQCDVEEENAPDDDTDAVESIQKNNGGILGDNLIAGSQGAAKTVNNLFPYNDGKKSDSETRIDTARTGDRVNVSGETEDYPFTTAAHHLIPGNASLKKSDLFKKYMTKGAKVETNAGNKFTVNAHIGYNVNGCHNGVWLPGNYAIRKGSSAKQKTWGKLVTSDFDWCLDYMAAVVKKAGGQFHDAHTDYSKNVLKSLNKLHTALLTHQDHCEDCKKKTEIAPPFMIKKRLYLLSAYLRQHVTGPPTGWRPAWYTSDRFRPHIAGKAQREAFQQKYTDATP